MASRFVTLRVERRPPSAAETGTLGELCRCAPAAEGGRRSTGRRSNPPQNANRRRQVAGGWLQL